MRIIEQLVYKITGDNREFDKSIDKSETKVNKFGSVADKMLAGVTVAAITMVVKKVGDMVVATAQATDRVDKMSQKIGISRTAFQEWDFILSQSGASVEGLQMGVKTLSNAADEARKGTALYAESFDRLGVSVTDVNGDMKDQETLFNEVFKALANVDNQTERTAIANKLLGRSATELAPAFNAGGDAIEDMRSKAHQLGLVMGDDLIDKGVVLTDNIDKLKRAYKGWKNEALEPLLGLAVTFTDKILGQNSASKNLKSTYDTLQTAVTNYNTILDTSKGKTDAVTQATISQAKAQLQLALQKASEAYRESNSQLDKYNSTIQKSEKWIGKYDKSLSEIAQSTGYTTEQLNLMTEQERLTIIAMAKSVEEGDRYNTIILARKGYQEDLIKATTNLSQAEASQENFINLLTQGYVANNEVTKLLLDAYPELEQKVLNNVEAYNKEQKEIEKRNKAIELATVAFRAYENASDEDLKRVIAMAKGQETSAYWAEMSRLATEKLNERIAENSLVTDKQTAILANNAQGMEAIDAYALALGDTYNATSEKTSLLTSTIKALIDSGLTAEDEAVANLITQLKALATTTEEVTDASVAAYAEIEKSRMSDKEKALKAIQEQADAYLKAGVAKADVDQWQSEQVQKYQDEQTRKAQKEADKQKAIEEEKTRVEQEELEKRTKATADAYKLLESYSLSEKDKAIANIQAQADKFLEAKVSEVDVEKWKTNELAKLQEQQAKKAEEEAERVRKAWEDATFSMLGSVTSIWGSINQVQANQNEEEIQRIKEQNAIAIQAAKDRGASEEEITELEKSLQADLNDAKNKYAQEEAERNKALSTLSVILDTAKAIMQIWANPLIAPWGKGLWTGLAAGAGAAQIAAINSAPVPSYDVGSIRIPETTTATVHKDEMILTAPQAEQARREGITIAPTNKTSGTVPFVVQLDGREIARAMLDNINTGSVGTIKARVVK